jgi:hypothetical protein
MKLWILTAWLGNAARQIHGKHSEFVLRKRGTGTSTDCAVALDVPGGEGTLWVIGSRFGREVLKKGESRRDEAVATSNVSRPLGFFATLHALALLV